MQAVKDRLTVVVGVDDRYVDQLELSMPTWLANRSELVECPLVVFSACNFVQRAISAVRGWRGSVTIEPWEGVGESQRHRMLAGFVHVPAETVATEWWMKLDCDVVAGRSEYSPLGFDAATLDDEAVIVAPGWSYTKPADQMQRLDQWANGLPEFERTIPLDLPFNPASGRCFHRRICSWVSLYRTEWSRRAASLASPRTIPVPSQDGYHWYVAARMGDPIRRMNFKAHGWSNHPKIDKLRDAARSALA